MRFNTALLHGDFRGDKNTGATQTPIYQSSAATMQNGISEVYAHLSMRVLRHSRRYLIIWHLDFHTVELAIQQ